MPVISNEELKRRRQEILESARSCFSEYGYAGATVRRLEEATGRSRGAIFHHFGDKESLFLEIARQDASRQAEIASEAGLVEVMHDLLRHPEKHDWLGTHLEISRILRTDPQFREKWHDQQAVLDEAVRKRLESNAAQGRQRDDVPIETIQSFLEIVMDGFINHLATGGSTEGLEQMLDLVEDAVRKR